MNYTKHFLKKTEDLFSELEYIVRYERGSFKSGYCIVEDRKIAVINKFFDTEARISTLMEILTVIEVDTSNLTEQAANHFKQLTKVMSKKANAEDKQEEAIDDSEDQSTTTEVLKETSLES